MRLSAFQKQQRQVIFRRLRFNLFSGACFPQYLSVRDRSRLAVQRKPYFSVAQPRQDFRSLPRQFVIVVAVALTAEIGPLLGCHFNLFLGRDAGELSDRRPCTPPGEYQS